MPGIEDWTTSPLAFVNKSFQSHLDSGSEWPKNVQEFFQEKLQKESSNLVSLNSAPNHALLDGQIVKFRCMIQDMFDPEIYLDKFEVKNLATGQSRFGTFRYQDTANYGAKEEPLHDSDRVKHAERLSFYCVSVPGESPWVKEAFQRKEPLICHPSTSESNVRNKRSLDDEEDQDDSMENATESKPETTQNEDMDTSEGTSSDSKKSKGEPEKEAQNKPQVNPLKSNPLNLPLPKEKGCAAIVKLYDVEDGTFKVNDIVEFTGIVSLNPILANPSDLESNDIFAQFNKSEIETKNPPPSLIPRLHVLSYEKLDHVNPNLTNLSPGLWEEMRRNRDDLKEFFQQLLLGDSLAAEYLLCHLISKVYSRKDGLVLGKFSLNLFNVPLKSNYSKRLATLLQLLMTKSHYFPLTVEALNSSNFVPKKDYNANRLISGALQLSSGTHLILDETKMNNGQLDQQGIINLTSLGQMIKFQSLDYDFGFHKLAFEKDVPCLILSEGRSMLPQDVQVMLKNQDLDDQAIDALFSKLGSALDIDVLNRLRNYLTLAKAKVFELSEDAQKFIQDDFVQERQNANSSLKTSEDLHSLLVLARLLALSRGESTLNLSIWNEAKAMESERKQRVAHLPTRPQM